MANPPYLLSAEEIAELRDQLAVILSNISNRLDAIEGNRGHASIINRMDIVDDQQNRLHGFTNEATPKASTDT
tara:strand:+ start:24 stop:242 length:219 start_codon:yes stop_codon:yes gene_type:complete